MCRHAHHRVGQSNMADGEDHHTPEEELRAHPPHGNNPHQLWRGGGGREEVSGVNTRTTISNTATLRAVKGLQKD